LSELSHAPASTIWHRHHGRLSTKDAAASQQYLTPSKEKALVDYVLRAADRGYPVPVKLLRHLAWTTARQQSSTFPIPADDDAVRHPGKNWAQSFYKRHPELKPRRLRPLDWARHDIYEKVAQWFTIIGRELHDPTILAENVYNMDETGIIRLFGVCG
jgi:hypothetical protein